MRISQLEQEQRQRKRPKSKHDKRDKIVDLTGIKPAKKRNTVRSGLGDYSSSSTNNNAAILFCVPENMNKDLDSDREDEDEYKKYDEMWDGQADQLLINSGATIIRSKIQLSDSGGRNRTVVRK